MFIDEFQKSFRGKTVRLVAGIDLSPEDRSKAIFYLRMEAREKGRKPTKVPGIWLSLSELTRLAMLMSLSTRFWFETIQKGKRYTKRRVREFQQAWDTIQDAIVDLLPP